MNNDDLCDDLPLRYSSGMGNTITSSATGGILIIKTLFGPIQASRNEGESPGNHTELNLTCEGLQREGATESCSVQ